MKTEHVCRTQLDEEYETDDCPYLVYKSTYGDSWYECLAVSGSWGKNVPKGYVRSEEAPHWCPLNNPSFHDLLYLIKRENRKTEVKRTYNHKHILKLSGTMLKGDDLLVSGDDIEETEDIVIKGEE